MRARISLLVMMLAIGCAGLQGQSNTPSDGGSSVPDTAITGVPGSKDKPITVSPGVMMRLMEQKVDPVYPKDAGNVGGSVVMLATVDDHGKIVKLSVVAGPERLRDAAQDAVNQWTFKPYLLNGIPAFVKTQFTVQFHSNPVQFPN